MNIERRRSGRNREWPPRGVVRRAMPSVAATVVASVALACAVPALALLAPAARAAARHPVRRAEATVSLVLPLRANVAGLERFARDVSTPGSSLYGQFEPVSVLARRFGVSQAQRARVLTYLRGVGATGVRIDVTGLFADATLRVSTAQRLFATRLGDFHAADSTPFLAPVRTVRIPGPLSRAVTGVIGLDTRALFGSPRRQLLTHGAWPREPARPAARIGGVSSYAGSGYAQRTGTAAGCSAATSQSGFTPNQYLTAYGYSSLHAAGIDGQGERVALIEIDGFRYSDLRHFAQCFRLATPAINGYGVGLRHPLPPGAESTLDLEVLDAAAPDLKAIDVYESRPSAVDVLHSLTAPLRNAGSQPDVISASLGSCESATLDTIGSSGLRTVEGALALAAATGISVFASSGDDGSSACLTPGGRPLPELAVSYPASSPWVTGVGGTNVALDAANQITAQQVWNDAPLVTAAGGGGQSALFGRPWYQNGFVSGPHRAVPDVSMLADVAPGYEVYCTAPGDCNSGPNASPWTQVGGTSAAAPLLAGGIALVDQQLRVRGHQNVGLVNPLLYEIDSSPSASTVISDVTTGGNDLGVSIVGSPLGCCTAGPGYDEASGLGSVNLAALASVAAGAVPKVASVALSLPAQRRPVAAGRIQARVSCSSTCLAGAYARIAIGSSPPATQRSATDLLERAGSRTVAIDLDRRVLARMRRALARHRRIVVTVYGAVYSAGGEMVASTPARTLRIAG